MSRHPLVISPAASWPKSHDRSALAVKMLGVLEVVVAARSDKKPRGKR